MRLNKDLRELVELLNSNHVEFLIVGGFAVAWHGYPRFTADLDFLVRPGAPNAERIVATLDAFGFGTLGVRSADLMKPDQILQLGAKPNRIASSPRLPVLRSTWLGKTGSRATSTGSPSPTSEGKN